MQIFTTCTVCVPSCDASWSWFLGHHCGMFGDAYFHLKSPNKIERDRCSHWEGFWRLILWHRGTMSFLEVLHLSCRRWGTTFHSGHEGWKESCVMVGSSLGLFYTYILYDIINHRNCLHLKLHIAVACFKINLINSCSIWFCMVWSMLILDNRRCCHDLFFKWENYN